MNSLLVTNNDQVIGLACLEQPDAPIVFRIEGHAIDVLRATRDLLLQGWKLSVDPLAGHYVRLNPFHTILLQKGEERQSRCKDLARIDRALEQWERNDKVLFRKEQWQADFQAIDCSLTACMLDGKEGE